MGLHRKAYILGLPMIFVSSWAAALGLGEIKLNSTLNQPLDAEVKLINVRDLTKEEIIVRLAVRDDFDRAGVDLTYFLTQFKYSVDLNSEAGPVVYITTDDAVKEPFLNFIVVAEWPSGKLLREYTLLVDLPVFSGSKARPVVVASKAPVERPQRTQTRVKVAPERNVEEAYRPEHIAEQPSASTFDSEVYGPVGSSDTLWTIAVKVRPDSSFTIQQTMLAIQRLNPSAFINNNINLLRRGHVLRVPDAGQINSLSTGEAVREVAGQNSSWSSGNEASELGSQLEGSKSFTETNTDVTEVEGRVKLSSQSAEMSDSAQGADDGEQGGAQIEKNLDEAQEELDAVDRENAELESKLGAIDEQIETIERMVEVSNEELRALELASQRANEESELREQELLEAEAAALEETSDLSAIDDSVADEPAENALSEAPEEPSTPAVLKPEPERSVMDLIMANITYVLAAIGSFVLLLGAFLYFRNKDDGFDDDFDDELEGLGSFEGSDMDEGLQDFDDAELNQGEDDTEVIEDLDAASSTEEPIAEAETEDVVGECDIHLAYGQYDQAEEKLLRALESEPGNGLIRLKLMEVLAAQGDAEGFDGNYAKILVLQDEELSARAASLREGVIDISAFDESKHDTSDFEAVIGLGATEHVSLEALDDSEDETVLAPIEQGSNEELIPEEFDLDDDVTVIKSSDASSEPVQEEAESVIEDDGLELDLLSAELGADSNELDSDAELAEFDFGDLELDLGEADLDLDSTDVDGSAEEEYGSSLGQMDDSDELEFDLESDDEIVSPDFTENLIADSAVLPVMDDESVDFASLGLDLEDADLSIGDTDELEDATPSLEDFEVDLGGADLSDELAKENDSDLSLDVELGDFGDLGDLGELDLDDGLLDLSSESAAAPDSSDFEDVVGLDEDIVGLDVDAAGLDEDVVGLDEDIVGLDVDAAGLDADAVGLGEDIVGLDEDVVGLDEDIVGLDEDIVGLDEDIVGLDEDDGGDFDVTFDLGENLDLDELDSELDELAAESSVDTEDLSALEDSDLSLEAGELLAQPEASELSETVVEGDHGFSDLGDLQAVAANEDDSTGSNTDVTTEFDASSDFEIPDFDPENDDDSNLDFLSDNDETATKLDLARAYIDMGDADGAKDILDEILEEGNDGQRKDAEGLLKKLA